MTTLISHYTDAPEDNLLGITDKQLLNEEEARGVVRAEAFLLDLELPVELLLHGRRTACAELSLYLQ